MKLVAIVGAICALSQTAIAQTGECKLIANATARLACYDKASPIAAQAKPAASRTAAAPAKNATPQTAPDQGQIVDLLAVENSKLDAKLKTICRGC